MQRPPVDVGTLSNFSQSNARLLLDSLSELSHVSRLKSVIDCCLDVYSKYMYPITPLVDIRTLKSHAEIIYRELVAGHNTHMTSLVVGI